LPLAGILMEEFVLHPILVFALVTGREDCMYLYTGKSAKNWETSSCFYERPFICQVDEGSKLPPGGVVTGALSNFFLCRWFQ